MDGNKILTLISTKNWAQLLSIVRDNKLFSNLLSDPNFMSVFNLYFVNELLYANDDENEEYLTI
jgi:hypothetical protein